MEKAVNFFNPFTAVLKNRMADSITNAKTFKKRFLIVIVFDPGSFHPDIALLGDHKRRTGR
jgi:hypothetical protein